MVWSGTRMLCTTTYLQITHTNSGFFFLLATAVGSTGSQVVRHSLSYIQEIGNGWFGKVRIFFLTKAAKFCYLSQNSNPTPDALVICLQ